MAQNYLKGVKHEFIKPVSESKFSGDVLVFRDSDKNPIEYSMNMIVKQFTQIITIFNLNILKINI